MRMSHLYHKLVFPLLTQFPAETVHDLTLASLSAAQESALGRALLRRIAGDIPQRPVHAFGFTFPNVLGLAAGFDKDARAVAGLARLGFGHIEVGTVTPYPQAGNPKPRIFRLRSDRALINRMGFPNQGVVRLAPRLRALPAPRDFVLGVSLGKQKETPLAQAAGDYVLTMQAVYAYADYLAVNISSPNTPGLRELQGETYIAQLLDRLQEENEALAGQQRIARRPLLVKIAPDLDDGELETIVHVALQKGVDGMIATNTTLSRHGLTHASRREEGGLSGEPLRERSTAIIAGIRQIAGDRLPIVAAGGVASAAHVREKLDAGASLVQVYTGLVYEGPGMPGRILRALSS